MIIKKTKDIKIFNFMNKEYHIQEQINRGSREKNKKILEDAKGLFKMKKSQKLKLQKKDIEYWSDIFDYKDYKVKVVKYIEIKEKKEKREIYVVCTDTKLNERTINKIIHARWEIENEGFNELKNGWNMKHCYIGDENTIDVILQMIIMSYNIWKLYLYGHLHEFEKNNMTKLGYIEMIREKVYEASREVLKFSSA